MILAAVALASIPYTTQAGWDDWLNGDSWKQWAKQKAEAVVDALSDDKASKSDDTKKDDEFEIEHIDLDAKKEVVKDTSEPKVDFYDTLGIKYFPAQYLAGNEATLKKYLNTLFKDKKHRQAVAYFISLERKNHAAAISLLESMPDDQRLVLLLESPAAFTAKILVEMRNIDFKGKTLSHWGPFELQSEYYGRKKVAKAEIKGESVSLRYIMFLLTFNTNTQEEFAHRAYALAQILSNVSESDLSSLLVYSHDEVLVKMGQKHESCFGAVKTKGYCDEETPVYLPEDFVGPLLNFMHSHNMISKQAIVKVLEAEFYTNIHRFNAILKGIDIKVIQDVALNFSEEIIAFLPDEVILGAMPAYEEVDNSLRITDGKNNKTVINNNTVIDETDESIEKEEL